MTDRTKSFMRRTIGAFLITSGLVLTAAVAQQNAEPQLPAAPEIQTGTMSAQPQPPSPQAKSSHLQFPDILRQQLEKRRAEIEKATGIPLSPVTPDTAKQETIPCQTAPAPTPKQQLTGAAVAARPFLTEIVYD